MHFTLREDYVCGSDIQFSFDLTKKAGVLIMFVIEVRHNNGSISWKQPETSSNIYSNLGKKLWLSQQPSFSYWNEVLKWRDIISIFFNGWGVFVKHITSFFPFGYISLKRMDRKNDINLLGSHIHCQYGGISLCIVAVQSSFNDKYIKMN